MKPERYKPKRVPDIYRCKYCDNYDELSSRCAEKGKTRAPNDGCADWIVGDNFNYDFLFQNELPT